MDPEKVDLSPLDPTADARHWERLVQSTLRASVPTAVSPLLVALSVRGGLLAALACAALLAWVPTLLHPAASGSDASDPVVELADLARSGSMPDATSFRQALEDAR